MIRILHILTRLCVGGTCAYVMQLSHALNNDHYQSYVLTGMIEPDEADMSYLADRYGIKPHYVNTMCRSLNPVKDFITIIEIIKVIRKIKPDVVFTNNAKAGVVGRIAAFIMGVPIIIHTYHGNNFSGYFGKLMSTFSIITEKALAFISTCLVAISPQQYEELSRLKIAPEPKIRMIPLGFDLAEVIHDKSDLGKFRAQYQISSETKIVALVGRLAAIKNPAYFINIAKAVLARRQDTIFLLVGDGELRPELQEQIDRNELQKKVIITGFIKDLKPMYADIDILMLTSNREGTPVSIIEAMANRNIVISTRVGGVENLIDNEVNGFVYAVGDMAGMISRIDDVLNNPESYISITERAHQKIVEHYSMSVLEQNIKGLITEFGKDSKC
ncbi:MAG: glycosyltransferase [Candidatus Cloacimonadaceae bacterium]|nr:glycosyltransferase [Candidatus Cloacimonadaceae bacterium]